MAALTLFVGVGGLMLARFASPDALSSAVVLFSLYLLVRKKTDLGLGLLCLSILIRPDNMVTAMVVLAYCSLVAPVELRITPLRCAGFALAGTALYAGLARFSGLYGWSVLFRHSFIEKVLRPADLSTTIGPVTYLSVVAKRLLWSARDASPTLLFLFFVWMVACCAWGSEPRDRIRVDLAIAVSIATLLRFLVYPFTDPRLCVVPFVLIGVALESLLPFPDRSPAPGLPNP